MSQHFNTAQDAEDAYYDALESGDLEGLFTVWSDTDDISCQLPMYPLALGREAVMEAFGYLFSHAGGIELAVEHLHWIETPEMAIHLVEETSLHIEPEAPPPVSIYATNIYRKESDGWRIVVHQNSPKPPPPGSRPQTGP